MTHSLEKSEDTEVVKKMPSSVYMPLLLQNRKDKELSCVTTGYPIHLKCRDGPDNHPPKTLFIEYHSPVPQYIRGKSIGHHGNNGPCYLCHHGNMITPTNGCISYAPLQVPPRYNGVCFCLICQQRAASLSCNCQTCLSLRFEQTAASVLQPSDKELSIKKSSMCCNVVVCDNMPDSRVQYPQYCHCAECVSKMSKDLRLNNNNLQVIVHRSENMRPEGFTQKDKDQNNNDNDNDQHESTDIKTDVREQHQRHNGDMSPKAKELTDESTSCSENQNRKRKYELNDDLFVSKIIKRENTETTFEVKSKDETASVDQLEKDTWIDGRTPSPTEEREKQLSSEITETFNNQGNDSSPSSPPEKYHVNQFDYKDNIKTDQDSDSESQKGSEHRHYNTRLTSTKTPSYDDQVSPKLKKDKELYADLSKSISRQRSKLNRLLANEHERRRVAQLNNAYQDLRQLIPGYQCDTKLPKIKILRYAINYIAHLDNILEMDGEKERV